MMIKPEAVAAGKVGTILGQVEANGFRIERLKSFVFSQGQAEQFYAVHRERPFFRDLVRYISGGAVVGVHCRRAEAVRRMRELVGATNPARPHAVRSVSCMAAAFRRTRSMPPIRRKMPRGS